MAERSPPTTLAIAIATAIIAGISGFFLGQASSIGFFSSAHVNSHAAHGHNGADTDSSDDDFEQLEKSREGLSTFEKSQNEECKLVLVVRTDLGMGKGKIAAQCSHATLACYKALSKQQSPILRRWEAMGQAKVALKVESEDEMELLQAQALSLGLCSRIIHDAGRTQIASGSATVLGVGPGPKSVVDQVTGGLKLL